MSLDYDFNASDLDEFLVEYVDGTMDPVVREAFEEFLRVYPEVAEQVDCLASVRSELCRLGDKCRCHAPPGFQDRLKEQLLEESDKRTLVAEDAWLPHLNTFALAFSLTLLALAVGLSSSTDTRDTTESVAAEVVDDARSPAEIAGTPSPLVEQVLHFDNSVAFTRDVGRSVSHTHPGSREVHVEAAFDRPMLLSVRRDIVAMRPISTRDPIRYTRP